MNKILLVGPSNDITNFDREYFDNKKKENYKLVSFSNSLTRFLDLDILPDYWSFIDPFSVRLYFNDIDEGKLKSVELLTLDLYDDELTKMSKVGYKLKNLDRNKDIKKRFCSTNFDDFFKKHHKIEYTVKKANSIINDKDLFSIPFKLIQPESVNHCKFSTFILPLLNQHFDNISEITVIGFGQLNKGRYIEAKNSRGNKEYRSSFNSFKDQIKNFIKEKNIKIVFEGEHSEYSAILN